MRVLLIGPDSIAGKSAYNELQKQNADITVLVNSEEKKLEYQKNGARAIVGEPTENSAWMNNIPEKIEYVLNFFTPTLHAKADIKEIENKYAPQMLHVAQNIIFIAREKKMKRIFQPCNAFFYKQTSTTQITENMQYDNTPENYGVLYSSAIKYYNAQKDIKTTFVVYGHYLYTSDGNTFPEIPTLLSQVYLYCQPGDNHIQLTHAQDLGSAMALCAIKEIDEPIINIADDQPLSQIKFVQLFAKINNKKYVLPVRKKLLKLIMGDAYTNSITADIVLKNNLIKSKGYWLKYPTYNAGFAKEYFT